MQIENIINHRGLIYQPIPFEEYKNIKTQREDCEERYQTIKQNYSSFVGKTLIDICCANGFFLFRFMQDGGRLARGIEIRREIVDFVNILAIDKNMDVICNIHLNGLKDNTFDIGIYLDTHYVPGTQDYLEWLSKHTKILFTSCAHVHGEGIDRNEQYQVLLSKLFKKVEPIFKGFAGRIMFRCE